MVQLVTNGKVKLCYVSSVKYLNSCKLHITESFHYSEPNPAL